MNNKELMDCLYYQVCESEMDDALPSFKDLVDIDFKIRLKCYESISLHTSQALAPIMWEIYKSLIKT